MSAADRLIQSLSLTDTDGVVILDPSNVRYFSGGFTGEGALFITRGRRVLLTDSRFTHEAAARSADFEVLERDARMSDTRLIASLCRACGMETLFYEDDAMTVRAYRHLKDMVDGSVSLHALGRRHTALRCVKQPEEIACIRRACTASSLAFERLLGELRPGLTEQEVALRLRQLMLEHGGDALSFPVMAASGPNSVLCHAQPTARRLQRGDLITLDFGCRVNGYCADMTRTVALGQPAQELQAMHEAVLQTQQLCLGMIAPGQSCCDLDRLSRDTLMRCGYRNAFSHALGHGVGLDVHEPPALSESCGDTLQTGMTLAVEPGVYVPGLGGVRIEDTVLVTDSGCEVLTNAVRELICV